MKINIPIVCEILIVGTFLVLHIAIQAIPLEVAQASGGGEAEITNHSSFRRYERWQEIPSGKLYVGNLFHVVGVIRNVGTENIKVGGVERTYYDVNGTEVEPEKTEWEVQPSYVLAPDEKTFFEWVVLDSKASQRITRYDLSPIFEATTKEPYRVDILDSTSYLHDGSYYVVGELENRDNLAFKTVTAVAAFYGDGGELIDVDQDVDYDCMLLPGEKLSFKIENERKEISSQISSYESSLYLYSGDVVEDVPPYQAEFQILWHRPWIGDSRYNVQGEVKNSGDIDATFVHVTATFYDLDGKVVDLDYGLETYAIPHNLKTGQTAFFVVGTPRHDRVASYSVQIRKNYLWKPVDLTGTSISCDLSTEKVKVGRTIVVSGSVEPPLQKEDVTLWYFGPDGALEAKSSVETADGKYQHEFKPSKAGSWSVRVSWNPETDYSSQVWIYYAGASATQNFTVEEKIKSEVSCLVTPSSTALKETVSVSGSISPTREGASVTLTYVRPDASTVTRAVTTTSTGTFKDSYTPDQAGVWSVYASWSGDEEYEEASSPPTTFTVVRTTPTTHTATTTTEKPTTTTRSIETTVSPTTTTVETTLPGPTVSPSRDLWGSMGIALVVFVLFLVVVLVLSRKMRRRKRELLPAAPTGAPPI